MNRNKGKKQSKEHLDKRIQSLKKGGKLRIPRKPLSESTKEKISKANKGTKPSQQTILAIKKALTGKVSKFRGIPKPENCGANNHQWKGGITPINAKIRTSLEYKIWRRGVFERDKWTCVWCGDRQEVGHKVVIHADHIKPFAYFPELRFALDNGRTLCI